MSRDRDDHDLERGLLHRPFLDGASLMPDVPVPVPEGSAIAPVSVRPADDVRPYLMTGGRTVAGAPIAMETVVVLSDFVRRGPIPRQAFERAAILRMCHHPCSVAEIAARLDVPLQVALVLVADLVVDGLLIGSGPRPDQARDIGFLERLIAGVSAL